MALFSTTDVDLVAFLECRGIYPRSLEEPDSPPWLATFQFEPSSTLDRLLAAWNDPEGDRSVDALHFAKRRVRVYRRARTVLDEIRPGHRERGLRR